MSYVDRVAVKVWPDTRGFDRDLARTTKKRRETIIEAVLDAKEARAELAKLEGSRTVMDLDVRTEKAKAKLEDLKKQLAFDAEKSVEITADIREAKIRIAQLRADLAGVSDRDAKVAIRADIRQAQQGLAKLRVDMLALRDHKIKVNAEAVEARRELDRLEKDRKVVVQAKVDSLNARRELMMLARTRIAEIWVRVNSTKAMADIKAMMNGITGANLLRGWKDALVGMFENLPQTTLRVMALGSALAALVLPAMSALSSLAPIGASLNRIGPIVLAAVPLFGALAAQVTVLGMAFWKLADSTAPAAKRFNEVLTSVRAAFGKIRASVQEAFFSRSGFTTAFKGLTDKLLPKLKVGLSGVAGQVGLTGVAMMKAFGASLGDGRLDKFFRNLTDAIHAGIPGVRDFTTALTNIGTTGSEVFPDMARWINNIGKRFRKWTESSDIEGMLREAAAQTGFLWDAAKNLGSVIAGIFRAMDTGKSTGMESFATTLGEIRDIVWSPRFQEAMRTVFTGAADGATALKDALMPVGDALERLAPTLAMLLSTFGTVAAGALVGIANALAQPVTQEGIQAALTGIRDAAAAIDWNALGAVVGSLGKLIGAAAPNAVKLINAIAPALPGLIDGITRLVEWFGGLPVPLQLSLIAAAKLGPALAAMIISPAFLSGMATVIANGGTFAGILRGIGAAMAGGEMGTGAAILARVVGGIAGLFTTTLPAALSSLGAGIMAIPVWGWIVAGVVAAVAALTWFFTQTEVGRQAWADFTTWLGQVWQATVDGAIGIWNSLGAFFSGLWEGMLAAPQAVVDWFNNTFVPGLQAIPGLVWQGFLDLVTWFFSLPGLIFGALLTFAADMVTFWGNLFVSAIEAVSAGIEGVVAFFVNLPANILAAIGWLIVEVPKFFSDMWTAITAAVTAGIDAVVAFFANLPANVIAAVTTLTAQLGAFWNGLWATVTAAVTTGIAAVAGFFGELPAKILSALASLASDLYGAMTKGMSEGNKATLEGVAKVVATAGEIPGKILKALGDLGSTLWNAGKSIMDGFLRGLKDSWKAVTDFVGGIADWIARNKGPLSYDYRLLQPAGKAIMTGFEDALAAGMRDVESLVSSFAPAVSATVYGPSSTDNQSSLTPSADDLAGAMATALSGKTLRITGGSVLLDEFAGVLEAQAARS